MKIIPKTLIVLSTAAFISAAAAPMASADEGAGATTGAASGASPAAVSPAVCTAGSETLDSAAEYQVQAYETYVSNPNQRVYGAAGGTLSFEVGQQSSTSIEVNGSTTAEAGAVFAKASATLGIAVSASSTTTTQQGYSWQVPADQAQGWLEMGAMGYQLDWQRGHYNSPCIWVQDASGSTLSTSSNTAFSHS